MTSTSYAERFHDISCGHRVVGHENKCRGLHGHNYRMHFTCTADQLDGVGRIIDFGVIKDKLCMWIEDNWDHKMLLWEQDPVKDFLFTVLNPPTILFPAKAYQEIEAALDAITYVPFNPTAENMALYLLNTIGPLQLAGTGVYLISVRVEETHKCSAIATLD